MILFRAENMTRILTIIALMFATPASAQTQTFLCKVDFTGIVKKQYEKNNVSKFFRITRDGDTAVLESLGVNKNDVSMRFLKNRKEAEWSLSTKKIFSGSSTEQSALEYCAKNNKNLGTTKTGCRKFEFFFSAKAYFYEMLFFEDDIPVKYSSTGVGSVDEYLNCI